MFLLQLLFILRRRFTAKPRCIKLEHGTVYLSGFPKEIANELEAYMAKFTRAQYIIPVGSILPGCEIVEEKPIKQYKDKAIGLREINPRQYELVVVGYDVDGKEAGIEEVRPAGDFKDHASSVFRQELFKRGFV